MHNAEVFGVCKPSEVLPNLLMDGAWMRCERCRKNIPEAQLSANRAADADVSDVLKSQALEQAASFEAGMEKLKCVVCKKDKTQSEYHHHVWKDRFKREHRRCRACFQCPTCAPGTKHILADFVHGC